MADDGAKKEQEAVPESVPDPEEDDLDDLDDILDEFQHTKLDDSKKAAKPAPAPEASGPGRPAPESSAAASKDASSAAPSQEDFAKELQNSMAEMLRELESNPQMAKEFEEMMSQFGGGAGPAADGATASKAGGSATDTQQGKAGPGPSFEDSIKKTMERMQASESSASAAAAQNSSEEDFLASMMREMQNSGGEGGDDAFSKMLLGMMEQLTNKEILYEPMKELNSKFPAWLEEHTNGAKKGTVPEEDMQRYKEQAGLVKEIVDRFEKPDYKDSNSQDREFVVERMQKMQSAGAPPSELVGDMSAAENMLGELDGGCPQQ